MTTSMPQSHLDLFEKKAFAYLATHLQDASILVNPVWCDYDGTHVLINSAQGRLKDRMMRRHPNVTVCIADPENPYRYLEIRGRVADVTTEGAEAHIDRMAKKYLGQETYPFRQPDGGENAHDYCMFCSCTPEQYEPHMRAFSPHVSRDYADQQNSQPVIA